MSAAPAFTLEAEPVGARMQQRNFHGFRQYRFGAERWRFYVSTFSCDGKTAHVLNEKDTLTGVPITPTGYITIGGRKYGPREWDH